MFYSSMDSTESADQMSLVFVFLVVLADILVSSTTVTMGRGTSSVVDILVSSTTVTMGRGTSSVTNVVDSSTMETWMGAAMGSGMEDGVSEEWWRSSWIKGIELTVLIQLRRCVASPRFPLQGFWH
jgi:hypothetical protein